MSGRYTPKKSRHQKAMDRAVEIVADTERTGIGGAVERAMERSHEENPAGFHLRRPSLLSCPFDDDCPFV